MNTRVDRWTFERLIPLFFTTLQKFPDLYDSAIKPMWGGSVECYNQTEESVAPTRATSQAVRVEADGWRDTMQDPLVRMSTGTQFWSARVGAALGKVFLYMHNMFATVSRSMSL